MSLRGIGLIGGMRSGKDTIADYATEKYGMVQFSFAEELKRQFHEDYPHIPRKPKPVRGYQLYGQLKRYTVDDDIWVNRTFEKINFAREMAEGYKVNYNYSAAPDFIPIIKDVRQPNEVEKCKSEGFILIRVNCPLDTRIKRMRTKGDKVSESDFNFETEKHIDTFRVDYDIDNSGTLQYLYDQFDSIMSKYLQRYVEKDYEVWRLKN